MADERLVLVSWLCCWSFLSSPEEKSRPEAALSSRSAGDRLPGAAEVPRPAAAGTRPRQTLRRLTVQQEAETPPPPSQDADAGGNPENLRVPDPLHQAEGSSLRSLFVFQSHPADLQSTLKEKNEQNQHPVKYKSEGGVMRL